MTEDWKSMLEIATAAFTALMAACTAWLALETRKLEKGWRETSKDQIGVTTWLELERRFDSEEIKLARKKFAQQLKTYAVAKHDKISETVLNFFESVGIIYKEGYLNTKLADSSFSFYAVRYWEAAKAYVDQEQKRHGDDTTLFEDFKEMAELMRLPDEKIDDGEIQRFLDDEIRLV